MIANRQQRGYKAARLLPDDKTKCSLYLGAKQISDLKTLGLASRRSVSDQTREALDLYLARQEAAS